jgi:hypothetical protein
MYAPRRTDPTIRSGSFPRPPGMRNGTFLDEGPDAAHARHTAAELTVIAAILGLFGVLIAVLLRAAKQRPSQLARLREAPTLTPRCRS